MEINLVARFHVEVERARSEYEKRRNDSRYDPQVVEYYHGILRAMLDAYYIVREESFLNDK